MDSVEGRAAMEETTGLFGLVKMMIKLNSRGQEINRQLLKDSWAAAQAADPDLIIIHPKGLGGVHIGEKLNVPVMMAVPAPLIVPTAQMPPLGLPELKLGGWYNKAIFKLVELGYRSYNVGSWIIPRAGRRRRNSRFFWSPVRRPSMSVLAAWRDASRRK